MAKKKTERKRRKEIDDPDLKKVLSRIAHNLEKKRGEESLQALATRAKVTTSTVWEIENQKAYNIKLHTLITIARALGTDLSDLLK